MLKNITFLDGAVLIFRLSFLNILFLIFLCSNPAYGITDSQTGLEWQHDSSTERDWQEALEYCANSSLSGHTDWRLPNVRELDSLVDLTRTDPSIHPDFQCESSNYWTSTSYTPSPASAWVINFTTGNDGTLDKDSDSFVRCVRAGIGQGWQPPKAIADTPTGLEWQQDGTGETTDWQTALNHCEIMELEGVDGTLYNDWRLPDVRELDSLVDLTRTYPAINPELRTELGNYWTSTTYTPGPANTWVINFITGDDGTAVKTGAAHVRCVRSTDPGSVFEPPATVTFWETGLEWQQTDDGILKHWQQAVNDCDQMSLEGKNDWRLPNIRELDSLVDLTRTYPAIDPALQAQIGTYWSSTTYSPATANAWSISFVTGNDGTTDKDSSNYARCVRDIPPDPVYIPGNTVKAAHTGLEWQKSDDGITRNWQDALAHCEAKQFDGKTDWRMPNIRELDSLVDLTRTYPSIDPSLQSRIGSYWSSTSYTPSPANAWSINFTTGNDGTTDKDSFNYVRCVRDRSSNVSGPFLPRKDQCGIDLGIVEDMVASLYKLERYSTFFTSKEMDKKLIALAEVVHDAGELKNQVKSLFEGEDSSNLLYQIGMSPVKMTKFYDLIKQIATEDLELVLIATERGVYTNLTGRACMLENSSIAPFNRISFSGTGGGVNSVFTLGGSVDRDIEFTFTPYEDSNNSGVLVEATIGGLGYRVDFLGKWLGMATITEVYWTLGDMRLTIIHKAPGLNPANYLTGNHKFTKARIVFKGGCDLSFIGGLSANVGVSYLLPYQSTGTPEEEKNTLRDVRDCLLGCTEVEAEGNVKDAITGIFPNGIAEPPCFSDCFALEPKVTAFIGVGGELGPEAGGEICVGVNAKVKGTLGGGAAITASTASFYEILTPSIEARLADLLSYFAQRVSEHESLPTSKRSLINFCEILPTCTSAMSSYELANVLDSSLPDGVKDNTYISISGALGVTAQAALIAGVSGDLGLGGSVYISLQNLLDLMKFNVFKMRDEASLGVTIGSSFEADFGAGITLGISSDLTIYELKLENIGQSKQASAMGAISFINNVTGAIMISDTVEDVDGDGKNDFLTIDGSFTVDSGGTYSVLGALYSGETCVGIFTDELIVADAGEVPLSLHYEGLQLTNGSLDGPYQLNLSIFQDDNEEPALDQDNIYTTGAYLSVQFQSGDMQIDSVAFSGIDGDENELFEELQAQVTVTTSKDQNYFLESIGMQGLILSDETSGSLLTGSNTISILFDGKEIRKQGIDSPYGFRFVIKDVQGLIHDIYEIDANGFVSVDFEAPAIVFTEQYSTQTVDSNNDGYFDSLVFVVGVQVSEAGTYRLKAIIYGDGQQYEIEKELYLSPSQTEIKLSLDGLTIRRSGINQTFTLQQLSLSDPQGNDYGNRYNAFTTVNYDFQDFEQEPILLAGSYSVQEIDSNGTGDIDTVQLQFDVNVNATERYWFSAKMDCGSFFVTTNTTAQLSGGLQTVDLDFSINDLFRENTSATCAFTQVAIVTEEGAYIDYAEETGLSYNYDWTNFDKPCTGDLDGDGTADLADLILGLKIMSGQESGVLHSGDCNGDGMIGLPEVINMLRVVAAAPE